NAVRVLLAFDKFKDAIDAPSACDVAALALRSARPRWSVDACPLTDGGDGFCEILTRAAGGRFVSASVTGPRGEPLCASVGLVRRGSLSPLALAQLDMPGGRADDLLAVVESATASGLARLRPENRDPWQTTTRGTGQLLQAATAAGVAGIVLGIGGSATNDVGAGALSALGLRFLDSQGRALDSVVPAQWPAIGSIGGEISPALPPIRIACDVRNPLLGPSGCTATFGPQKGLALADVCAMETATAGLAKLLAKHGGLDDSTAARPGAGAAGGLAFGLMTVAGARLLPGFDLVAAWLNLDARIAAADLVLTGEGRWDGSSRNGKAAGEMVRRARAAGREVHVFVGSADSAPPAGAHLHTLAAPGMDLPTAVRTTSESLRATIMRQFR
ncbi:MAG TPA: glycerate kinase, partial [Opitutus sp.]|nr:glycerate kinase [Opitutus sp.]